MESNNPIQFFHLSGQRWSRDSKASATPRSGRGEESTSNRARSKSDVSGGVSCVDPKLAGLMSPKLLSIVREASRSLERGGSPKLTAEGLGGTYVLSDQKDHPIAVFKPCDEEPCAVNNPKNATPIAALDRSKQYEFPSGSEAGSSSESGTHTYSSGSDLSDCTPVSSVGTPSPYVRMSVPPGEAAVRECAAFLLDHDHFAGVPETCLVKSSHSAYYDARERMSPPDRKVVKEKVGALQEYIEYDCNAEEMGPGSFPVSDVHRIAILDIRLCNTDRHAGNILIRWTHDALTGKRMARLVPIDHGYCLPDQLDDVLFDWHYWPQAKQPLSNEEISYIMKLDAEKDAEMLKRHLPISNGSIRTLKVCTMFLKKTVLAGLSLFDIGELMVRNGCDEGLEGNADNSAFKIQPSKLEMLCKKAEELSKKKVDRVAHLLSPSRRRFVIEKYFLTTFSDVLDGFLKEQFSEKQPIVLPLPTPQDTNPSPIDASPAFEIKIMASPTTPATFDLAEEPVAAPQLIDLERQSSGPQSLLTRRKLLERDQQGSAELTPDSKSRLGIPKESLLNRTFSSDAETSVGETSLASSPVSLSSLTSAHDVLLC